MKPSLSIVLDKRREKIDLVFPVKLRVYYNYKAKFFSTKWDMSEEDFKDSYESIKPKGKHKEVKNSMIALEAKANGILEEMTLFSFEEFETRLFRKSANTKNVFFHFNEKIRQLESDDQFGTASSYRCAMNSLIAFLQKDEKIKDDVKPEDRVIPNIAFETITIEFLNKYEKWMIKKSKSMTTIGIYLRNLRSIFNNALREKQMHDQVYPFGSSKYQIPQSSSVKKSLDKLEIQTLIKAEAVNQHQVKSRDFFLFSYLSSGMNIRDILELKFNSVNKDTITFFRAKTKRTTKSKQKPVIIGLGEFQKNIISKYSAPSSDSNSYVFPFFTEDMDEKTKLRKTQNFTRYINQHIKALAKTVEGLDSNISTYFARHSFTTNAVRNGASLEMISESLGHQSLKTTQHYWSGFADKAKLGIVEKLELDFN